MSTITCTCGSAFCWVDIGLPEQAVGWLPPRFGIGCGRWTYWAFMWYMHVGTGLRTTIVYDNVNGPAQNLSTKVLSAQIILIIHPLTGTGLCMHICVLRALLAHLSLSQLLPVSPQRRVSVTPAVSSRGTCTAKQQEGNLKAKSWLGVVVFFSNWTNLQLKRVNLLFITNLQERRGRKWTSVLSIGEGIA